MTVNERLEKIEAKLDVLVERQSLKHWYSTGEFAQLVGKAEFTVRQWCRLGRIRAERRTAVAARTLRGQYLTQNYYGISAKGYYSRMIRYLHGVTAKVRDWFVCLPVGGKLKVEGNPVVDNQSKELCVIRTGNSTQSRPMQESPDFASAVVISSHTGDDLKDLMALLTPNSPNLTFRTAQP